MHLSSLTRDSGNGIWWSKRITGKLPVSKSRVEPGMHVPGRQSTRHMKGKQVAMTLYLPPNKYWLLKSLSHRRKLSMQFLLRQALDQVLLETARLR
jgi:hypothetical protein